MAKKKYEIIRPKSIDNESYAEYEYLIRWKGRNGADYIFMFYDAEIDNDIRSEVINRESSTNIQSLNDNVKRSISLYAGDLSQNDLNVIGEMFSNKYVTRLKKDGTIERYAPDRNRFKYRLKDGRYELNIDLVMTDLAVYR